MHTGRVEQVFFLLPHLEYLWNSHNVYQNLFPWIQSDKYEAYVTIRHVFGSVLESMGLESGLVSKRKQDK